MIRSGTWPARWCRSARHQPFRHRRKLGTLQPRPQPLEDGETQAVARRCTGVVKLAAHVSETAARNGRAPGIYGTASPRPRGTQQPSRAQLHALVDSPLVQRSLRRDT